MANYVEIFFATTTETKLVVAEVSSALGIPLAPSDEPYADYRGDNEDLSLDLKVGHALEDDLGIPFEAMPYILTVRDHLRGQLEEAAGRRMFHVLERLGYRPLYLVKELQQVLEAID